MYGMQCNGIISNIVFIRMFFTLFSNKNNYNKIRFFFQIIILEHFHLCLANRACLSHLLCGQVHLLVCYYRNCLIGTHMCLHPVSKWSVFFTLQCELFTSYNVSSNASLVYAWTGKEGDAGKGRGRGRQPIMDRPGQGEGVPKIPKFVRTSFKDDPFMIVWK